MIDGVQVDARPAPAPQRDGQFLIDLALQGGGSHGAFTWGVLDRLLEEPRLRIGGILGTSAGAMNAAVLADGYAEGGANGARAALDRFWREVSRAALLSPLRRRPLDVLMGRWTLDSSPAFLALDLAARLFSPYDANPLGLNPLAAVLDRTIDSGQSTHRAKNGQLAERMTNMLQNSVAIASPRATA